MCRSHAAGALAVEPLVELRVQFGLGSVGSRSMPQIVHLPFIGSDVEVFDKVDVIEVDAGSEPLVPSLVFCRAKKQASKQPRERLLS